MKTPTTFSLTPTTLEEAMSMAKLMAQSEMVPKDYQGKPGNVLVAVQMGAELGLKPVQSLQNIAVVNGRPSVWGDGLRALIMSAPDLVNIEDSLDDATITATCRITRKINGNNVKFEASFSKADAEAAGLWGRNTWKQYPKKMLEWRAFGFAARKAYADRLRGIQLAEESQDLAIEPRDMGSVERVNYSDEDFAANSPKWISAIESRKMTADQVIAKVEAKAPLTEEQKNTLKSIVPKPEEVTKCA